MLDPHFKAMLDELAKIEMPPLAVLPPAMVREGYRATRVGLDAGAPRDLDVRDLSPSTALKAR